MTAEATVRRRTVHRHAAARLLGALASLAVLGLALCAGASADSVICEPGSTAGACQRPQSVAFDREADLLFVADQENNRVDVFQSDGTFLSAFGWGVADGSPALQTCTAASGCRSGIAGSAGGQLNNPTRIAVDEDPTSAAHHDVYVFDASNSRVQRFTAAGAFVLAFGGGVDQSTGGDVCTAASGHACGPGTTGEAPGQLSSGSQIAVGPGGVVHVVGGPNRLQRFTSGGTFLTQLSLAPVGLDNADGLAVAPSGDFYTASGGNTGAVRRYDAGGTLLSTFHSSFNIQTLALGGSGELYVSDVTPVPSVPGSLERAIYVYDEADAMVRVLYGNGALQGRPVSLANGATLGDLFAAETTENGAGRVVHLSPQPPGPAVYPDPARTTASPVGNTSATISAPINPEGKATTYRLQYVETATFQKDEAELGPGHGFDHAQSSSPQEVTAAAQPPFVEPLFGLVESSATIGCTGPTPQLIAEGKCLKPSTAYRFRAVAENADGTGTGPIGELITKPPFEINGTWASDVGTDAARLSVEVNPFGIAAAGRLEWVDAAICEADEAAAPSEPAAHCFDHASQSGSLDFGSGDDPVTRSIQLSGLVPGTAYRYRAYVADPFADENGPVHTFITFPTPQPPKTDCHNQGFRGGPSAFLPDCRAYEMVSPLDKNGADISVLLSNRGFPAGYEQSAEDGEQLTYSSAAAFAGAVAAPYTSQYLASRDPVNGWRTEPISPSREGPSFTNNATAKFDAEYKAFAPSLSSGWLIHDTLPSLNSCDVPGYINLDRRDLVRGTYEALTTAKPTNQTAVEYWPELQGLSADGSHAVFSGNGRITANASSATIFGQPIEQLYEHVAGNGCGQLRLVSVLPNGQASASRSSLGSRANQQKEGRENAVARAVSSDGSRIFWSVAAASTGTGPGALYVRIGGTETVEISPGPAQYWTAATDGSKAFYTVGEALFEFDVETEIQTSIADGVIGVAEASEDGSLLYFVSKEMLGGEGTAGQPNLYLHGPSGEITLVATLGMVGVLGGGGSTFDGHPFTVATSSPLKKGTRATPDGEHLAFLASGSLTGYDAADAADGRPDLELYLYDAPTGRLACISCNPSGARPAGRRFENSHGVIRVSAQMAPALNQLYAPRSLSADGNRLFFESYEALLPRDSNGAEDVYEWERAESQSQCEAIGAELYAAAAGGCLSLISSGKSPGDSTLADASASGDDVFIKTAASLLAPDPGLVDIYDARVGGGFPQPVASASCEGEACQSPPAAPDDPTPASSAFSGAGNERAASKRPCPKGKRRVGRHGRQHCVKRHRKRHHHKRGGSR